MFIVGNYAKQKQSLRFAVTEIFSIDFDMNNYKASNFLMSLSKVNV